MKRNNSALAIIALAILLAVSLYTNWHQYQQARDDGAISTDTTMSVTYREVKDTMPRPAEVIQTGKAVTAKVVTPAQQRAESQHPPEGNQTDQPGNTIPEEPLITLNPDSTVTIPITQKIYRDSLYTAYVSGYAQSLDSITVRERITTLHITKTKRRKWNIGINAGYGIGLLTGKPEPFLGFGITYTP